MECNVSILAIKLSAMPGYCEKELSLFIQIEITLTGEC